MANTELATFCRQVRKRSQENKDSLYLLHRSGLTGNVMSILRQELDSMVRCIFLLSINDGQYRERLIYDAVTGNRWRKENGSTVTDRDMVEVSSRLHGWTRAVYEFGCAFIHLSAFHDYSDREPFDLLTEKQRRDLASYLHHYHGVEITDTTKFCDIVAVLPDIFTKISNNLECYVKDLETGSVLETCMSRCADQNIIQ